MPTAAVVLAGGRSSRMGGGDKPLLQLGGRHILMHIVDALLPQTKRIAINANGDPDRFAAFGLPVITDSVAGQPGPLAGILAGMVWAADNKAKRVLTVPGDTPFLPVDLITRLEAATVASNEIAVAASNGNPHPVVALWPVSLRDRLSAFLERGESRKVRDFIAGEISVEVLFPISSDGLDPFFNINRLVDLAYAEAALQRRNA